MHRTLLAVCAVLLIAGSAAAVPILMPDSSQQTNFIVAVCGQANVSVPDEIMFDMVDVNQDTTAFGIEVSVTSLTLTAGNALRIELMADAAEFIPPAGATVTFAASDISWEAGAWTGGTGYAGTLTHGVYKKVAESVVNPSELSCANMSFTVKAKPALSHAGNYYLTGTWRFSSFVP